MSGIEERIARIIAGQFRMRSWDFLGECDKDQYRAVAAALVANLGLRDETAFRYTHQPSGRSSILTDLSDVKVARKIASDNHALTEVVRYVTDWRDTE
jgi:hypothetical protein